MSRIALAGQRSLTEAVEIARSAAIRARGGKVHALVTLERASSPRVRQAIERAGGEITDNGHGDRLFQAFLPPGALRSLAREDGVLSIARPPAFHTVAGIQMTQGDAALNGPAWRSAGKTGAGIKIGIIDVGFTGYSALLGSDLPAAVTVRNFVDGESQGAVGSTTEHGTACAEIIHDIAPGAQLYLAKVGTLLDIGEAADWLQAQGVRIISSSIGIYNVSPGDGTGYLENIVAAKRAAGITWFTAAGNDRESHWGGASNIGSAGNHRFATGQNVNFFGPGDGSAYAIGSGYGLEVSVRWDDWTPPVDQDFDVQFVRWSGSEWLPLLSGYQYGGKDFQNGGAGQRPVETAYGITYGNPTAYGWMVKRYSATQTVNFEMFTSGIPIDKRVEQRSLSNLADANSAVTVAALDVSSFAQEPYSAEGPTNGPGGTATGGQLKPDISAFANVNTVSYGSGDYRFNGTSAATPHVAGAAALALQANPGHTPNALEGFLTGRAVDQGPAGPDNDFGHGRLQLGSAPSGSDTTGPVSTAPNADFRSGVAVGTGTTPVKLSVAFSATDPSGISKTQLQQKVGSAAYANVTLATATSVSANVNVATSSTTLRTFRARATDTVGNVGAYATGSGFKVRPYQNGAAAIVQSGSWTTQSKTSFYGGSVRHTNVAGRKQSLSMTMQDVAIVTTTGPNRGIAKVFVDGVEVATVDLYSSTTQYRRVVWSRDFGTAGSHSVEWRVTGTKRAASTGTRVDLDAFLVMRP